MKDYHARLTKLVVLPKGEPIFHEQATEIEIVDEAGGEFIIVTQHNEGAQAIRIDPEEWPYIRQAIERMVEEIERNVRRTV
jgi:hypothetical protein